MTEARRRDEWDRVSLLVSEVANHNFTRKKPTHPRDFNPFVEPPAPEPPMGEIKDLRDVWKKFGHQLDKKQ
jgi:hypothetical protein